MLFFFFKSIQTLCFVSVLSLNLTLSYSQTVIVMLLDTMFVKQLENRCIPLPQPSPVALGLDYCLTKRKWPGRALLHVHKQVALILKPTYKINDRYDLDAKPLSLFTFFSLLSYFHGSYFCLFLLLDSLALKWLQGCSQHDSRKGLCSFFTERVKPLSGLWMRKKTMATFWEERLVAPAAVEEQ